MMFSTDSVTEMEDGSHVTLSCLLHTHDSCGGSERSRGVRLSRVDEGEKELQNSTSCWIRTVSTCNIALTLTDQLHYKTYCRGGSGVCLLHHQSKKFEIIIHSSANNK